MNTRNGKSTLFLRNALFVTVLGIFGAGMVMYRTLPRPPAKEPLWYKYTQDTHFGYREIDWQPTLAAAQEKARAENKPILINTVLQVGGPVSPYI